MAEADDALDLSFTCRLLSSDVLVSALVGFCVRSLIAGHGRESSDARWWATWMAMGGRVHARVAMSTCLRGFRAMAASGQLIQASS